MASLGSVWGTLARPNRRPPPISSLLGQRQNYSPLPVRPTSKARKLAKRAKAAKLNPPPPSSLVDQTPPQSSWNLSPSSFWNPATSSHPNSPSFPWTEYDSSRLSPRAPARATNVPNDGSRSGAPRSTAAVVQVPEQGPQVVQANHPAAPLLSQSALVIVRQLEMMNLFIGFEQANRYRILSPTGETLGFLAEEERGFSGTLFRQIAGTHRAFQASIFDPLGAEILRIRRPFSLINSRIFVEDSLATDGSEERAMIGESQQEFHLWRRRYNLFTRLGSGSAQDEEQQQLYQQFARIDAGFLSWDFFTLDANARPTASVSKNFTGFGREIFTDTGQYVVRFDAVDAPQIIEQSPPLANPSASLGQSTGLTLDQRAVILATAVSIDFDYFSRSHRGGLMPPIFFGGGSSSDGDF
ncbi:hypothetical protein PGT21_035049 [Puccinia graminis f. sp. tritici]|uniref:Phospholipid scramblase n=1 Tax=Puccinia graminis f. sp. tritici TaxID=56615 RepID=A0A5B0NEI8_PUCGR|nr:hypothetical protein PGT21_035049 [Puccinia graminis f. sp. tritici]